MLRRFLKTVLAGTVIGAAVLTSSCTKEPVSISVSPSSVELTEGESSRLSASVAPADAKYGSISWSSSNDAVAVVSSDGTVHAMSAGTATITASTEGIQGTATVKVKSKVLPVESVTIDKTSIELTEGDSETLTATVKPDNATDKSVSWKTGDSSVATVDANGTVTAVKSGETTITVTTNDGGKTATCKVAVIARIYPVESVLLDKAEVTITEGETAELIATVKPDNATDKSVSWKSGDTSVATVDENGTITAVIPGETTITVTTTDGGKTAECKVTVSERIYPVDSVSLDKTSLSLVVGSSETLTATIKPDNATDKSVSWKSGDTSVATVDEEGKVTALKPGTATITVTTTDGGKTAECKVTVSEKVYPVQSVSLNKTSMTIEEGATQTLSATIKPSNASDKSVSWKSSDSSVATVDASGKVTGVKPGTATITVTTNDGRKTATCKVTVTAKPVPVIGVSYVDKGPVSITIGDKYTLEVKFNPENTTQRKLVWKSSNTSIATVDQNGTVTGVAAGLAYINVTTESGSYASIAVDVVAPTASNISLNYSSKDIIEDGSYGNEYNYVLVATVTPASAAPYVNVNAAKGITILKTQYLSGGKVNITYYGASKLSAADLATSITVSSGSITKTCSITVKENPHQCIIIGYDKSAGWDDSKFTTNLRKGVGDNMGIPSYEVDYPTLGKRKIHINTPIKSIPENVASGEKNIVAVYLPETVKKIGKRAFYLCDNLYEVEFNNGLEEIGDEAFAISKGSNAMGKFSLPNTLKTIGNAAFANCKMGSVTIPASVQKIGGRAFYNTSGGGVVKVTILCKNPPVSSFYSTADQSTGKYYQFGGNSRLRIYVSSSSLSIYSTNIYFSEYAREHLAVFED